jgi:hypothetical protein
MTERGLIDVKHWSMIERAWKMDLRGRGSPPSGAPDTIAAGLLSEETMRASDSPRIRFLLRPLPGADTSWTVEAEHGSAILLHTVGQHPDSMIAALARNDGLVGISRAVYENGIVRAYEATWADTSAGLLTQRVSRRDDGLHVSRSGGRDTVLVMPNGAWGIADYSMQELLAPALLALPRDTLLHPIAIYRPFSGHWDTGVATMRERAGLLVFTLQIGSGGAEFLVFTPEGDYLYGENGGPTGAKRFPSGAERQEKLRAFFATLKGGG